MNHRIKIVGLGGIGSVVSEMISRYVNYSDDSYSITLIDGDSYELKNFKRQTFSNIGNKANIKFNDLVSKFENVNFISYSNYVKEENIKDIIEENDIILICVDNHKTRKVINDRAKELDNVTVISGGNEYTDGNIQIYIRMNGVNQTPSITDYHPEIENADDRSPDEMSCEELAQSEPQLLFTNLMAATLICCSFYNIMNGSCDISEVYFDIESMNTLAKKRKVKIN